MLWWARPCLLVMRTPYRPTGRSFSVALSDTCSKLLEATTTTPHHQSRYLKSLELLQNQLHDAQLCIQDCREATCPASLSQEVNAAEHSLAQSVRHLIDVLEDDTNKQQKRTQYHTDTHVYVQQIRELRSQLERIQKQQAVVKEYTV